MSIESVQSTLFRSHSIIYQSPQVKNPIEARIILMGELHGLDQYLIPNAKLIDSLIKPRSILLFEGIRSMYEISPAYVDWHKISPAAQSQLICFGWDRHHHMAKDASGWVCEYTRPDQDLSEMPDPRALNWSASGADWTEFPLIDELTAQDFPARTAKMVETLKNLSRLESERGLNGRVFLIAGKDHLTETKDQDPRRSLKPLYEILKTLSAVVVTPERM